MIIKSLEQLNSFSKKVADNLKKKDFIFLVGEIGVGKTTFTRFLINYLQKKEGLKASELLSPTFNLLYEYDFKKYKIMHYDLYRLKNEEELNNLGILKENEDAIKIIEWPKLIKINISDKLEINFDYTKKRNERKLKLFRTGKWKNFE